MITFAFDNSELINLLKKRGQTIKFEKYDAMRDINDQINLAKNDPEKLAKFYRPVTAFLTFENEEGLNRMGAYNELVETSSDYDGFEQLLGCPLEIDDASEPTDIIWENRHFTSWDRTKRATTVFLIISGLLFASFILLFQLTVIAQRAANKYPIT